MYLIFPNLGAVIPLLLLLVLIIYYLSSVVSSLKDANNDLKLQIRREKDAPEVPEVTTEAVATPATEKKHVRINEDINTDSDKAKLLKRMGSTES